MNEQPLDPKDAEDLARASQLCGEYAAKVLAAKPAGWDVLVGVYVPREGGKPGEHSVHVITNVPACLIQEALRELGEMIPGALGRGTIPVRPAAPAGPSLN